MASDNYTYSHLPVWGLPRSSLIGNDESIPIIALMQSQAGLNREFRRNFRNSAAKGVNLEDALGANIAKNEWALITHFLSAEDRFFCFWYYMKCLQEPHKYSGKKVYPMALSLQFLKAYASDWYDIPYDETVLCDKCSEWKQIQKSLEKNFIHKSKKIHLGVFMLWPRLIDDLSFRWGNSTESQRRVISNAIFALTSISYSQWFIETAIRLCPELESDLGHLLKIGIRAVSTPTSKVEINKQELKTFNDGMETTDETIDLWNSISQRLNQLVKDWPLGPSKQSLQSLANLGTESAILAESLTEKRVDPAELFEKTLEVLQTRLVEISSGSENSWITEDDVASILARWYVARKNTSDSTELEKLEKDAQLALVRIKSALVDLNNAQKTFCDSTLAALKLEEELQNAKSARLRVTLSKQQLELNEKVFAEKSDVIDLMLFLMSSASPWGETFDPEVNYNVDTAPLESPLEVDTSFAWPSSVENYELKDAINATELLELSANDDLSNQTIITQENTENLNESIPNTTENNLLIDKRLGLDTHTKDNPLAATINLPSTYVLSEETGSSGSAEQQPFQTLQNHNWFNENAGQKCKPIWTLLNQSYPGLAYQFAEALSSSEESILIPYPELLKCIALSKGLNRSDGQLAVDISEAFDSFDQEWFNPKGAPSNWHTAVNLLLIAATIKPMIFAPASNASKVASYRHLDGRYSTLLKLVQEVSEVSESLTAFVIGPTILQSVLSGNNQKSQLAKLSKGAEDWLIERAPHKKFSYSPANKVWLHWLRPGELLHNLMNPIACGNIESKGSVRTQLDRIYDYQLFVTQVRESDRRQLRRRGQEIQATALDHLWSATQEAIVLAKEWLVVLSTPLGTSGRLVENLERLKVTFSKHFELACEELNQPWEDEWNQVQAASNIVYSQLSYLQDMFANKVSFPIAELQEAELQKTELLAKELLLVETISIGNRWEIRSDSREILSALKEWCISPPEINSTIKYRLKIGDFAGAELLIKSREITVEDTSQLNVDKARDLWLKDIKQIIQCTRKASEIGLAYGYLSDAERADYESEISAVEAAISENNRFDELANRLKSVEAKIEGQKSKRIEEAWRQLNNEVTGLSSGVVAQLKKPLEKSDIHTFNELLQRVRNGFDPWPEQETKIDIFKDYFPELLSDILEQLNSLDAEAVHKLIKTGGSLGSVSFFLDGDEQARTSAEQCHDSWANSCVRRAMNRENLRKILTFVGLTPQKLDQDRNGVGWILQTAPLEDREICPVPHFGSRANGRYKVHVINERLTPEDLLSRIGEGTQQTATIILYCSRPPKKFWHELALLSKERQRSFLLLDEPMLLYLLTQTGSRLKRWFSVALPFTFSEPYDASAGYVPSEMFYGRSSELELIKEQGGCYFIYGGRQLGKTALLRRAERTFNDPGADHHAIWVDLLAQGIGERRPASDIWTSLGDKLRELKIPGLDIPAVSTAKLATVDAFLAKLKNFLDIKPNSRILVLLDEADRFFEQDGLQGNGYAETRRLKELMDVTQRRFKVVFAGLHNVLRTVNTSNQPLGHLNEAIRIGPLLLNEREIRAAEQLITQPIEASGYEFEDRSLVMRILAQTNYYPSLIQLYCSQLLRHVRESKLRRPSTNGPRFIIEESDIESVFSGRPLRDAIRSKFRLTLQLDDRYEVIANAIGLEALAPNFDQSNGINWREIRNDCSTWWPEGFKTTSERDFLVLLEEMEHLGVLSEVKPAERFSLRNPNVLLLLGSKKEIENTLEAEREPRVEFESTIFRPALNGRIDHPARNPLTYRQLDEIIKSKNSVQFIASTEAGGGNNLALGLKGHPISASDRLFVLIDKATDKRSFVQELDKQFEVRKDGVMVIFVPASTPWTHDWVESCRAKVSALRSSTKTVSVVFHADPLRLWSLSVTANSDLFKQPWMSVLPWARGFVKKWLEELQLPVDSVDRLFQYTGYWGGILELVAESYPGAVEFTNNLDQFSTQVSDPHWRERQLNLITGEIEEAQEVLKMIHYLGDGVTEDDLVEFGELSRDLVKRTLRWGGPLGLLIPEVGSAWSMNPFLKLLFKETSE
ncbi:MAG: hypothetical protein K9J78_06260 [Polynucleobacter sp.]|nr:hypothetical protein [Polynucleobacter sp.]